MRHPATYTFADITALESQGHALASTLARDDGELVTELVLLLTYLNGQMSLVRQAARILERTDG